MDRLLDPRTHIGSDTQALEIQRKAHEMRALDALAEKRSELSQAVSTASSLRAEEEKERVARRAAAAATAAALDAQVAARTARSTFDLEDRARLRRDGPVRAGVDDPRLGPSSAQVFSGEDVAARERSLLQQAQVRAWTAQQVAEKEAARAAEREARAEAAREMIRCADLAGQLEGAAEAALRKQRTDFLKDNEGMAAEKVAARAAARAAEKVRAEQGRPTFAAVPSLFPTHPPPTALATCSPPSNLLTETDPPRPSPPPPHQLVGQESFATLNSAKAGMGLLAEDPASGVSALSPHRVRPEYFRGAARSPQQTASDIETQLEAKRARVAAERAEDAARARREAAELKAAALSEREAAEKRRAQVAETARVLAEQRLAQEARIKAEKAARLSNKVGDEFYNGFGKAF